LSWQQGCLTSRHSLIPSRAQASRSNMSTLGACGQMWRQISCVLCQDKTLFTPEQKQQSYQEKKRRAQTPKRIEEIEKELVSLEQEHILKRPLATHFT